MHLPHWRWGSGTLNVLLRDGEAEFWRALRRLQKPGLAAAGAGCTGGSRSRCPGRGARAKAPSRSQSSDLAGQRCSPTCGRRRVRFSGGECGNGWGVPGGRRQRPATNAGRAVGAVFPLLGASSPRAGECRARRACVRAKHRSWATLCQSRPRQADAGQCFGQPAGATATDTKLRTGRASHLHLCRPGSPGQMRQPSTEG